MRETHDAITGWRWGQWVRPDSVVATSAAPPGITRPQPPQGSTNAHCGSGNVGGVEVPVVMLAMDLGPRVAPPRDRRALSPLHHRRAEQQQPTREHREPAEGVTIPSLVTKVSAQVGIVR